MVTRRGSNRAYTDPKKGSTPVYTHLVLAVAIGDCFVASGFDWLAVVGAGSVGLVGGSMASGRRVCFGTS